MRLDHYVKTGDDNINMANILYSLAAIGVLVACLSLVLGRSLWNDFTSLEVLKNNRRTRRDERRGGEHSEEDLGLTSSRPKNIVANDVAWKKLQGDVFRKPEYSALLSALMGMGVQVLTMITISLFFFSCGLVNAYSRWYSVYSSCIYLILGGMVNGYITTRAMKYFGATEWHFAASASAVLLPIFIGITTVLVDFIDWFEKSDQRMPFTSIILWLLAWGVFNVPAVYFASHQGFMLSNDKPPCAVSHVHKKIP